MIEVFVIIVVLMAAFGGGIFAGILLRGSSEISLGDEIDIKKAKKCQTM